MENFKPLQKTDCRIVYMDKHSIESNQVRDGLFEGLSRAASPG